MSVFDLFLSMIREKACWCQLGEGHGRKLTKTIEALDALLRYKYDGTVLADFHFLRIKRLSFYEN